MAGETFSSVDSAGSGTFSLSLAGFIFLAGEVFSVSLTALAFLAGEAFLVGETGKGFSVDSVVLAFLVGDAFDLTGDAFFLEALDLATAGSDASSALDEVVASFSSACLDDVASSNLLFNRLIISLLFQAQNES